MIVKVQLSLVTSHGRPRVLVYNRDRTYTWEGPASPEVLELFAADFPKKFFEAHLDKERKICLDEEVDDPGW